MVFILYDYNCTCLLTIPSPLYDLTCKFMFQEICDLPESMDAFFENFNRDEDAV